MPETLLIKFQASHLHPHAIQRDNHSMPPPAEPLISGLEHPNSAQVADNPHLAPILAVLVEKNSKSEHGLPTSPPSIFCNCAAPPPDRRSSDRCPCLAMSSITLLFTQNCRCFCNDLTNIVTALLQLHNHRAAAVLALTCASSAVQPACINMETSEARSAFSESREFCCSCTTKCCSPSECNHTVACCPCPSSANTLPPIDGNCMRCNP
jgi:hypothetical protein